jgi:ABC-type multidrug transport system fused ATPase/permease subunit
VPDSFYNPDLIIVLKDGGVIEQGTHEELILARGLYYSMWQEQAADTISETSPTVVE